MQPDACTDQSSSDSAGCINNSLACELPTLLEASLLRPTELQRARHRTFVQRPHASITPRKCTSPMRRVACTCRTSPTPLTIRAGFIRAQSTNRSTASYHRCWCDSDTPNDARDPSYSHHITTATTSILCLHPSPVSLSPRPGPKWLNPQTAPVSSMLYTADSSTPPTFVQQLHSSTTPICTSQLHHSYRTPLSYR